MHLALGLDANLQDLAGLAQFLIMAHVTAIIGIAPIHRDGTARVLASLRRFNPLTSLEELPTLDGLAILPLARCRARQLPTHAQHMYAFGQTQTNVLAFMQCRVHLA